jgi:hypothetical protein
LYPAAENAHRDDTAYRFRVAAVNSAGTGTPTAFSVAVIAGAPAMPVNVTALPGGAPAATGSLIVSFSAVANHGSAITSYTATCVSSNGGATRSQSGTTLPLTVTTVTTGKTYRCTARATNARGAGPVSFGSPDVIVGSPAPPTSVSAVRTAAGKLGVTFTAGANHGSAITGYTAACTSSDSGVFNTKTGPASPVTVIGLTAGSTYTCTVTAINARGAGPESATSLPVTA